MGKPDQLAKRILREETAAVTNHRVTFEVPREVPVGALQPDGVVRVVAPATELATTLSPPWSRLRGEATLDAKMPGDHTDRLALARCELRRHARWVQHLEALRSAEKAVAETASPARAVPDPRDFHTWVVAPHVPQWLRDDAARGVCTLDAVAPGCWVIGPAQYETLWIAANELPLREDLLPLLVARSGRAQHEFLVWSSKVRGLDWTLELIKDLSMDADISAELLDHVPTDDEAQQRIKTAYTRRLLEIYPEAAHEIGKKLRDEGLREGRDEGLLQMLALQFKLRLDRALSPDELATLDRRVHTLGAERVGGVVLDMSRDALEAWLRDPHAA